MSLTDILAIVAIVMSAASLSWQAASWLLSGAVMEAWMTQGRGRVTITAYNKGRTAATITRVSIHAVLDSDDPHYDASPWDLADHPVLEARPLPGSSPVPYRIEGGGHGSWEYQVIAPSQRRCEFLASVIVGQSKEVPVAPSRRF